MTNGISAEICCASLEDCLLAERCGADAIELVSAHLLGGLTPTLGLLRKVKERVGIQVSAIVRPRGAGFCYSDEDFDVMCEDARLFAQNGADGIVFGFLRSDGSLDYERCARFLDCCGDCQTVFHRAIDVADDMLSAAEKLVSLGVTRVLTSGGRQNALDGAEMIRALTGQFGDKLQILAGGGIRADNVARIVAQTGVSRVHFGGTGYVADPSTARNPDLNFGTSVCPPNECFIAVNEETVRGALKALAAEN